MVDWILSGSVGHVEMPEAGGWMYMFRSGDTSYSHVFVPNMSVWADAIAAAMSPKSEPVALLPAPEDVSLGPDHEENHEPTPEPEPEHQPENS